MKFKKGVRLFKEPDNVIQKETIIAMSVADTVWKQHGAKEVVVTSVCEGRHSVNSLHYVGMACDLRIWNLPTQRHVELATTALRQALGIEYDVVLERDHVHVEYDPKA